MSSFYHFSRRKKTCISWPGQTTLAPGQSGNYHPSHWHSPLLCNVWASATGSTVYSIGSCVCVSSKVESCSVPTMETDHLLESIDNCTSVIYKSKSNGLRPPVTKREKCLNPNFWWQSSHLLIQSPYTVFGPPMYWPKSTGSHVRHLGCKIPCLHLNPWLLCIFTYSSWWQNPQPYPISIPNESKSSLVLHAQLCFKFHICICCFPKFKF